MCAMRLLPSESLHCLIFRGHSGSAEPRSESRRECERSHSRSCRAVFRRILGSLSSALAPDRRIGTCSTGIGGSRRTRAGKVSCGGENLTSSSLLAGSYRYSSRPGCGMLQGRNRSCRHLEAHSLWSARHLQFGST